MSSRFAVFLTTLAAAGAFATSAAYAADEAGKPTKSSLAPAGEGPGAQGSAPSKMSDKSRASVKSQTKAESKMGDLAPAGKSTDPIGMQTSNLDADKSKAPKTSTTSRADVKADMKAGRATGTLQPAGEAQQPSSEPPKK